MERSFSENVKRLEQQLQEIALERDAFEQDLVSYVQENKALKEQVARLRLTRSDNDAKSVQTLKEIQDLQRKKFELREEEFKTTLKEKEKSVENLQDSLKKLKREVEKCKSLDKENQSSRSKTTSQISTLKDKINVLEKENTDKQKQLAAAKNDLEKKSSQQLVRIRILEDQLKNSRLEKGSIDNELKQQSEVKAQKEKIKSCFKHKLRIASDQKKKDCDIQKQNEEIRSLQKQVKSLQKELNRSEDSHDQVLEELNLIKKEKEVFSARNQTQDKLLNSKVTKLQDDLNTKETQIKLLTRQLNNEKSKSENACSESESQQSRLKTRLAQLEEECMEKNNTIQQISEQLKQSESNYRSFKIKHQRQVVALQDDVTRLNNKAQDKDGEICSLNNQIMSLEKKDEKVSMKRTAKFERLQSELDQLSDENNVKDRKLVKLKRDVEQLESEIRVRESQYQSKIQSLEKNFTILRKENQAKEEEIGKMSAKLSSIKSESESSGVKSRIRAQTLEDKVRRLEKEVKLKNEELYAVSSQLSDQQFEVESLSSRQTTRLKMLEEKVVKLEAENKNKEDQLCKVSFKLAHEEVELDSVSSKYRVQVRTLEDKLDKFNKQLDDKEDKLLTITTELSEKDDEITRLKNQVRRLESENKRKDNDLSEMQSFEADQVNKSDLNMKRLERNLNKVQAEADRLKLNLERANDDVVFYENNCEQIKMELKKKDEEISTLNNEAKLHHDELEQKRKDEIDMKSNIKSLTFSCQDLKADLKRLQEQKLDLVKSVEDLSEKLMKEEKEKRLLQENSSSVCFKLNQVEAEQRSLIEEQKTKINDLEEKKEEIELQLKAVEEQNSDLGEKCRRFEVESSLQSENELQLQNYKNKLNELQKTNSNLLQDHDSVCGESRELKKRIKILEDDVNLESRKAEDLEKTVDVLKETCVMLEKQVEDLESFNNNLLQKENVLEEEKNDALRKCSELRIELSSSKHHLTSELHSLDQNSNDQITELKIELRNEMNNLHEANEQYRDLQQKYKNLELNATALQRKLKTEKDSHERCLSDIMRTRGDIDILQQSLRRAEDNLHLEIDRCDVLEREKTQMLNRIDTEKLEFSHELVRLNCQGAQQAKLIDFLQSRVEELEAADKKKKKKKTTLYQAPLQYRELCDLLDEEKSANVKLQEQVNLLRSELQCTNSKMRRMKLGMDAPLSPGSVAAISAIVKSPATSNSMDVSRSPKGGKQRSKPRMHHNIPHRLSSWVCHRASRCSVCLVTIHFGHTALRCSECSVICHNKCKSSITNTCGLPGGLFEQFKEGTKPSTLSPIASVFRGSNPDQLHGRLKVLCGDDTWTIRSVRILSDQLRIAPPTFKSPSKVSDKDDVVDLKQATYVLTDLNQSELPNTTKQDLSYAFKLQSGSSNSCWPARTIYFLAAGFAEKHLWVDKLEEIVTRHQKPKNISGNAKIFGNEILAMPSEEKLELNCSVPINEKTILFGCDEGLYRLTPSSSSVSSKSELKRIDGVACIYQLTPINKSNIVAIEGLKHRLVMFNSSSVERNNTTVLQTIENIEGCHLLSAGQAEGLYYLCVATATSIIVLKYNERMKKFAKKKEIATREPCTCMMFTACSIIIGTNRFYEIDLTEFKIDEFVDDNLMREGENENVFPVSILKIKERDGRQEFLLCYHEFGIFVDGFGHLTRSGKMTWSRMPLSFEYREPYLIVVQFNMLEFMLIDVESSTSAESSKVDRAFLPFPRVRYLGSAITEGAIYLTSSDHGRTSVFCCKGNMKKPSKSLNVSKRHMAALSSSMDSLSSPTSKRSTYVSDISSVSTVNSSKRFLSKSQQSIDSDTSKWSTSELDDMQIT